MMVVVVVAEVDGGGGEARGQAGLEVPLVEPALVDWLAGWIVRATHGVVQAELGHEAGDWLRRGPALADASQGVFGGEAGGLADKIGS